MQLTPRRALLLAAGLFFSPSAHAQDAMSLQARALAKRLQTQAQAAQDAATAAQAAAASACKAMPSIPPSELVGGSAGTATAGCRAADAVQPRITRAAVVTTDSVGAWTVAWASALPTTPVVLPVPVNTTSEPVVCNVASRTTSGASGRCWYARMLPATLTALTALVNFDVFGASASGIAVQVLAIPPTQ